MIVILMIAKMILGRSWWLILYMLIYINYYFTYQFINLSSLLRYIKQTPKKSMQVTHQPSPFLVTHQLFINYNHLQKLIISALIATTFVFILSDAVKVINNNFRKYTFFRFYLRCLFLGAWTVEELRQEGQTCVANIIKCNEGLHCEICVADRILWPRCTRTIKPLNPISKVCTIYLK